MVRSLSVFKALAHKTRLQIVLMLRKRSLCVYQITGLIGCSMATISAHLKCLKEIDLIESKKVNQHVYYSTNCLDCGENCNVCKILDNLELDAETVALLEEAERVYPQSQDLYNCQNEKGNK